MHFLVSEGDGNERLVTKFPLMIIFCFLLALQ